MKERYLRQVSKRLHLPRETKREVLRDLEEAFASAAEHGEAEAQVIERLGTPEEFAAGIHEQLGIPAAERAGWKRQAGLTLSVLIAAAAFCAAHLIHAATPAAGVIGQADATTTIQITGGGADVFSILILLGSVALLAAIGIILRGIHRKK